MANTYTCSRCEKSFEELPDEDGGFEMFGNLPDKVKEILKEKVCDECIMKESAEIDAKLASTPNTEAADAGLNGDDLLWCLHCGETFPVKDLVERGGLVFCPKCNDGAGIDFDLYSVDSDIAKHHMKLSASEKN